MHRTNIKKSSLAYATTKKKELTRYNFLLPTTDKPTALQKLDGSLPANPVNDRRVANAVTLKSTFCLP